MGRVSLFKDIRGAAAVEVALLAPFLFCGIMGGADLGLYVWKWNEALEGARTAARLAAVSDPVSSDLASMTGLETGVAVGAPAGPYERVCSFAAKTCTGGSFDQAAADRLFYGPASAACGDAANRSQSGLCDIARKLTPAAVTVIYRASGVDSSGVVGALRPLVSVRVSGAPADLVLLGRLTGGKFITLPTVEATLLAEDLRSSS
jgi:hypothetical protein